MQPALRLLPHGVRPGRRAPAARARAILEHAREARALGFTGVGITGGEPFLLDWMSELLGELAEILPVIVLSNATLFTGRRLEALVPLAGLPVRIQISLDSAEPRANDAVRGRATFAKVVAAVPELVRRGVGVRIATTLEDPSSHDPEALERLCVLHRSLGVSDEDHVVRPIVRRGRAATGGLGVLAGFEQLEPELTITADGAFASPFGPTVRAACSTRTCSSPAPRPRWRCPRAPSRGWSGTEPKATRARRHPGLRRPDRLLERAGKAVLVPRDRNRSLRLVADRP